MTLEVHRMHEASCHCGEVRLQMTLPNGVENPRRCDCSMCRCRGAVVASVDLENLKVLQGHQVVGIYQFNTFTAKDDFCTKCGIYTHHQRRSNPSQYGCNVACLEGINPFDLGDVPIMDGVNHPADRT